MNSKPSHLSKSRLMAARQCLKRLYLEVNRPELAVVSREAQAAFDTGNRVGRVAHDIYGTGEAVLIPYAGGLRHALRKTARLLAEGTRFPIFEATFEYGDVVVRVDVLLPDGDAWRIVEVKAATSVRDEHVFDCAVQAWVFQGLGYPLNSISLAHVDTSFVYAGDGDYGGLLVEEDLTRQVLPVRAAVPEWIARARDAAGGPTPEIRVGRHCTLPHECPFIGHCWPSDTEFPVQVLGGSKEKLGDFVACGYRDARDVPRDRLSDRQHRIQRVSGSGEAERLPGARRFIRDLAYPRYYLDFETIMPAVPLWAGTRPYETLPFQWSCHYEPAPGVIEHCDFLDLTGEPPMRRLTESLIRALGDAGPIIVYTGYERYVIDGLRDRCPDLAGALGRVLDRLVDLYPVTREFYYHPAMAGSWSLKAVLPTIAPELAYHELEGIQEGTAASEGYLEAIDAATAPERKAELETQLKRYCAWDTEGLVRLARFLGEG